MDLSHITIETDRLTLQSLTPQWREEIFQEFTEEVTVFMSPKAPEYIEETDTFIRESVEKMKRGEEVILVVLDKKTQEFLGIVGAHRLNTAHPELGVWIRLGAHGHKYGREAVTAAKQWVDENAFAYEYITYPVDKKNIPSRKIPESLGGTVAREFKKGKLPARRRGGDEVEYRIYKK